MTDSLDEMLEQDAVPDEPGLGRMARRSIVFAAGSITGKAIGLAMLPVLTRLMTPANYGSMDVLLSLASAIVATLMLGIDVAALRLYFDRPDQAARRRLIGSWYAIAIPVTLLAAALIASSAGGISVALFGSPDLQAAVVAVAVGIVAQTLVSISLTVLRARGRAGWYAMVNGGSLVVYAAAAVALLGLWRPDANAVLVAWAIGLVVAAAVGTFVIHADAFGKPTLAGGRALLRLGLPLAPAVAASLVGDFLNRTILLGAGGATEVAYYTVAARFASVAGLALGAIALAWQPRVYSLGTSGPARARLADDALWIVAFVSATVVMLAAFSPEIVLLAAGARYAAVLPALAFSLVSVLATTLYLIASQPSAISRATQDLGLATGTAVAVAVGFNVLLAPIWQSAGMAAAIALSQVAAVVVVGLLGGRRLALPIEWIRVGSITAVTGLAVLVMLVGGVSLELRLLIGLLTLDLIALLAPLRQAYWRLRARFEG